MLKGKNVVIVKGDKTTRTVIREYERVYLTHGAGDETESFEKTNDGKALLMSAEFDWIGVDGLPLPADALTNKPWEGIRPKGKTKYKPDTLVPEALAYMAEVYPGTEKEPADTYGLLLKGADYGADLWARNNLQADIRPKAPVDRESSIKKAVKLFMAMNPKLTLARATAMATAAADAEGEESAAA
jgi:hypothetical protein